MSFSQNLFGAGTNLTSSLGLDRAIEQKRQQSEQEAAVIRQQGQVDAQRIVADAEKSQRRKSSLFQTIGAIAGAGAGFIAGGPAGASMGAGIGKSAGSFVSGGKQADSPGADAVSAIAGFSGKLDAARAATEVAKLKNFSTEVDAFSDLSKAGIYTPASIKKAISDKDISGLEPSSKLKESFTSDHQDVLFKRKDKLATASKEARQGVVLSDQVLRLLDSDNPVADEAAITALARAINGPGVLTQQDRDPFGGSTAIAARFARFIEGGKTGKIDEKNRAYIKDLAGLMRSTSEFQLNNMVDEAAGDVSNITGLSSDKIAPIFDPARTIKAPPARKRRKSKFNVKGLR